MKTVLWDWNGTLLDDVQVSYDCLNEMLRRCGLPPVPSIGDYRTVFGFPVRDYYARVGIRGPLFDEVAPLWMDVYMKNQVVCTLRPDASPVLGILKDAGWRQVILSASKRENLLEQMERFDILQYFDAVLGLTHIYATDKTGIAREWLENSGTDPADCVMIGDTLHDADVARSLDCRCVLVSGGHQSRTALLSAGCPVTDSLKAAAEIIMKDPGCRTGNERYE